MASQGPAAGPALLCVTTTGLLSPVPGVPHMQLCCETFLICAAPPTAALCILKLPQPRVGASHDGRPMALVPLDDLEEVLRGGSWEVWREEAGGG